MMNIVLINMQASASLKSIIAILDFKSPRDGDFSILSPHGGLVVFRVGEDEEGDPQLVDLLQGQRVL